MEVIMVEGAAFNRIMDKLNLMEKKFEELEKKSISPTEDTWLDNQDVMHLLKISKRMLQTYRDECLLPFSKVGNKIYYKASDIQKLLEKNYNTIINFQ